MSPERAKVLIAEDDSFFLEAMTKALAQAGHDVVAKGLTLTEAKAMLSQIPELAKQYGEDKIVVVLGGSLGGWMMPDDPNNDSQVLLRLLEEKGLASIRTVGYSGNYVPWTTVDVGKEYGSVVLAAEITKL